MAYTETVPINLIPSNAGRLADLSIQLKTPAGVDAGSPITSGLSESSHGGGSYGWTYDAFTDGTSYLVDVLLSGTSVGTTMVDPPLTAAAIAIAVWNVLISTLTTAGSIGKRLVDFVTTLVYVAPTTPPAAGAIADAVWDEATAGHQTAGTTGEALTAAGSGGGGTGSGDVRVDHNYDASVPGLYTANKMQIRDHLGVPMDNATIRVYVAASIAAGIIDTQPPTTTSGSAGEWIEPLFLDPADYVANVYNPVTKSTKSFTFTVA